MLHLVFLKDVQATLSDVFVGEWDPERLKSSDESLVMDLPLVRNALLDRDGFKDPVAKAEPTLLARQARLGAGDPLTFDISKRFLFQETKPLVDEKGKRISALQRG